MAPFGKGVRLTDRVNTPGRRVKCIVACCIESPGMIDTNHLISILFKNLARSQG
jgi:hypothetical protein